MIAFSLDALRTQESGDILCALSPGHIHDAAAFDALADTQQLAHLIVGLAKNI